MAIGGACQILGRWGPQESDSRRPKKLNGAVNLEILEKTPNFSDQSPPKFMLVPE